jgi:hypothetical protein
MGLRLFCGWTLRQKRTGERGLSARNKSERVRLSTPRRRFTPREIRSFQWEVARGVKQAEVARKYGFSVSNFRRWFVKYGRPHIPYEPTDADRARAGTWREGSTPSEGLASSGMALQPLARATAPMHANSISF